MKNLFRNSPFHILCLSIILFTSCKKETILSDEKLSEFSESVNTEDIRHHIAVLADDSLKGRLPGTPEYDKAMAYVVDRYKKFGLKPLGNKEGSSYYQNLMLRNSLVIAEESFLVLGSGDTLKVGSDYFYLGNANEKIDEFSEELVIAGYGVKAPEYGFNDFENLDIEGKIAVVFNGAPTSLPASERAYLGSANTKIETLDKLGAAGRSGNNNCRANKE